MNKKIYSFNAEIDKRIDELTIEFLSTLEAEKDIVEMGAHINVTMDLARLNAKIEALNEAKALYEKETG